MAKKNSSIGRIDPEFSLDMKQVAKVRLDRGLAKLNARDLSLAEMTRLLRRTQGYKISIEELKTKPKKQW